MKSIHLQGSEDVRRAGSQIKMAADRFSQSVGRLESALLHHERRMEELLERFERANEEGAVRLAEKILEAAGPAPEDG